MGGDEEVICPKGHLNDGIRYAKVFWNICGHVTKEGIPAYKGDSCIYGTWNSLQEVRCQKDVAAAEYPDHFSKHVKTRYVDLSTIASVTVIVVTYLLEL